MKLTPILTKSDYTILRKLVKSAKDASNIREIALLTQELDRAIVKEEDVFDANIIRINSFAIIEDVNSKQQMKIQIVMPSLANLKEGKVSVLAPLSVAIIGFKENDQVDWMLPSGNKVLRIITVTNPSHN
jgi:regulator of nucleoside diphosphate kinase